MDKKFISTLLTWIAWGTIIVDLLLILFVLPDLQSEDIVLLIFLLFLIVLTPILALTWLMIVYRKIFQSWWAWVASVALIFLSIAEVTNIISIPHPGIALLLSIYSIIGLWVLGVVTVLLLSAHDAGLSLIAWISVIGIWALALGWRYQGNFLELIVVASNNPDLPTPLWWYYALTSVIMCVIPIAVLGFIFQTLAIFYREFFSS